MSDPSPFTVYILRCRDNSLYIGYAENLEERISRHNKGRGSHFTARRIPAMLVYQEPAATEAAAMARERQLKGWTRAKKEALIAGNFRLLKQL